MYVCMYVYVDVYVDVSENVCVYMVYTLARGRVDIELWSPSLTAEVL